MVWVVTLALLVVPALEFWLLGKLAASLLTVVLWCLATAAVGAWFARLEALDLWSELESDVDNGRVPSEEAVDAMLVVLGGWGLIIPGLLTDLLGGALLLPPVRRVLVPALRSLVRTYLI